jgi:TPP-dependent trihydroxycyclohexane-1,2-dione (THcHDO) dehydratase
MWAAEAEMAARLPVIVAPADLDAARVLGAVRQALEGP